jgi:hypothetical protein
MNSAPFAALLQASVATRRRRCTLRQVSLLAQTRKASIVRSMASSPRRPAPESPSPSLTIRENASTTAKPRGSGAAINSLQLLVPKSSAP